MDDLVLNIEVLAIYYNYKQKSKQVKNINKF